jgi:hypothetical protein
MSTREELILAYWAQVVYGARNSYEVYRWNEPIGLNGYPALQQHIAEIITTIIDPNIEWVVQATATKEAVSVTAASNPFLLEPSSASGGIVPYVDYAAFTYEDHLYILIFNGDKPDGGTTLGSATIRVDSAQDQTVDVISANDGPDSYAVRNGTIDMGDLEPYDYRVLKVSLSTGGNRRPVANAGLDREVSEGSEWVELDGSGSDDPDSDALSYQWTQVSGPAVALNNSDKSIANFDAPELDEDTELAFLLRVSDGEFADSDSVTIVVQKQPSPSSPPEPDKKEISAKTVPESIIIDGQLDEWTGANSVSFTDDSGRGNRDNSTKAYVLWDDTYLYIAFQVEDTELAATETAGDGKVWLDDAIEVFLDTQNNESPAPDTDDYQFIVGLNGAVYDSKQGNSTWDSTLQSAVKLAGTVNDSENDAGYTIEIAIPWSDIGSKPEVGAMMGIDFAVDDQDSEDGYQYSDWADISPLAQPDKWGKITYQEDQALTPDNSAPVADAGLDGEVSEGTVTLNNPDEIIANFDAPEMDEIDPNPVTPTIASDAVVPIATPEPGTFLLLGVGLIGVIALRRRARKRLSEN